VKVLFATDGAEPSEHAAGLLARLADPKRTAVTVLSVNDFDVAMREAEGGRGFSTEAGHDAAQRAVDEGVGRLTAAGFTDVDGRVENGDAPGEIVHAAEGGFELVVVGSGKERWLDRVVLGSVSGALVHDAPCPVLVAHEAPDPDRDVRVVVGADGSEGSDHAIAAFAALADPARCAVTVVTAATPIALPPSGPAAGELGLGTDATDDEAALAERSAHGAAGSLIDRGFRVETEVQTGGAAGVLLDLSERLGADLVVVGARGLGRFRAKVLGSVSDRVIRKARATLVGR
jgi:nucleotide-binding universal stress UspA family protein